MSTFAKEANGTWHTGEEQGGQSEAQKGGLRWKVTKTPENKEMTEADEEEHCTHPLSAEVGRGRRM